MSLVEYLSLVEGGPVVRASKGLCGRRTVSGSIPPGINS